MVLPVKIVFPGVVCPEFIHPRPHATRICRSVIGQDSVCICFTALKVYKELERRLDMAGIDLSVDKVLDIAKTITTIRVRLKNSPKTISRTMILTPMHKRIAPLFEDDFWTD